MPHHLRKPAVETTVRDSALPWTIIAPTMYQQTLLGLCQRAADGVVRLPYRASARFHLVDLADVACVLGLVAGAPAEHAYASYELAGPQRLSTEEMVEQVGSATGRNLWVEQTPWAALPLPASLSLTEVAERMAMFARYDRGGYPGNPTVLRALLGHDPTPLASTARR